jgi:hypothetical protein
MDNARWPWTPQYQLKRTKWWAPGENPADIIKEIFGEEGVDSAYLDKSGEFAAFEDEVEEDVEDPRQLRPKVKKSSAGQKVEGNAKVKISKPKPQTVDPLALTTFATSIPSSADQKRAFHTSLRALGSHSYNEDHVVPDFYIQHKRRKNPEALDTTPPSNPPSSNASQSRQDAAINESLMGHLSESILSDEVAASTMRRLKGKIPHEHYNDEGVLVHPSGYVIPTPGEAPNFMSERRSRDNKKQTAAVAERVQEEGDYTDINAHTRLHNNKVPYEVVEKDGSVSHPSGFVPPTAAHAFRYSDSSSVDNHVQDAVQRQQRRATTIQLSEEEMAERQRQSDAIFERDEGDAELIAELKAGLKIATGKSNGNHKRAIHTSASVHATEVPHPPFRDEEDMEDAEEMEDNEDMDDMDDMEVMEAMDEHDDRPVPPHLAARLRPKKLAKFPKHGKAPKVQNSSKLPNPPVPISNEILEIRDRYLPTLAESPFWRPLLSITLSTRPLALSLARLSRSRPRGLPFFATISNDDRKTHASYSARTRSMRIDRMENLTVQIAQLLAGARGGFVGIRFSTKERGRGIRGEGLEAPLPKENRTIKVGVGNWYPRAEEVKEAFREDAITEVGEVGVGLDDIGETFEITGLDDHGRRIDDKTGEVIPWPESKPLENLDVVREYKSKVEFTMAGDADIVERWKDENAKRREKKLKRQELARSYKEEIAVQLAQRHRSVINP